MFLSALKVSAGYSLRDTTGIYLFVWNYWLTDTTTMQDVLAVDVPGLCNPSMH